MGWSVEVFGMKRVLGIFVVVLVVGWVGVCCGGDPTDGLGRGYSDGDPLDGLDRDYMDGDPGDGLLGDLGDGMEYPIVIDSSVRSFYGDPDDGLDYTDDLVFLLTTPFYGVGHWNF